VNQSKCFYEAFSFPLRIVQLSCRLFGLPHFGRFLAIRIPLQMQESWYARCCRWRREEEQEAA